MRFDIETEINASAERVWAALVDVERWPDWMASYTSVERLSQGPLTVGSAARVRQPGLSAATYTVTELVPGVEFTWSSTAVGVRTTGRHVVHTRPDDRAALTLSIESEGLRAAAEAASGREDHP